MGLSPAQKRAKEMRTGKKKKKKKKQRIDPRTKPIVSKASSVKITQADGTVEIQQPLPATKQPNKLYSKPRARKAF